MPGIKTAWLGEHEKFIVWYAQKHGWDEEHGFKLDVLNFDSGKSILDGMKAYGWEIAGMGAVPALTGYFNKEIKIIAIANNESNSNMLYVRNNSPLLRQKDMIQHIPMFTAPLNLFVMRKYCVLKVLLPITWWIHG